MFKSQLEPPSENFVETQIFVENIFDTVKKAREAKAARSLAESKLAHYDYSFDFSPSKRKKTRKNAKNKSATKSTSKVSKSATTTPKKKARKPRTPKDKKQKSTTPKTPRKYTKRASVVKPQNDIDDEEAAFILSSISQRSFDSFYNRLNGSSNHVISKIQIPLETTPTTVAATVAQPSHAATTKVDVTSAYHHVLLDHNYWIVEPRTASPTPAATANKNNETSINLLLTVASHELNHTSQTSTAVNSTKIEVNNNKLPLLDVTQARMHATIAASVTPTTNGDNAVKKRWLRQATTESIDKSMTPSPETSPNNDMMKAPLKKRRFALDLDDNNEIRVGSETESSKADQIQCFESNSLRNNVEAIRACSNNGFVNSSTLLKCEPVESVNIHLREIHEKMEMEFGRPAETTRSVIQSPIGHHLKNNLTYGIQTSCPIDVNAIYGCKPVENLVKIEPQTRIEPITQQTQIYDEKLIKLEPDSASVDFRPPNIVEMKFNDKIPQMYEIKTEAYNNIQHNIKPELFETKSVKIEPQIVDKIITVDGKLQQLLDGKIQRIYRDNSQYFVDNCQSEPKATSYGQLYNKMADQMSMMHGMDNVKNQIVIHTTNEVKNDQQLYPKVQQSSPTKIGQLKGFSSPTKIQISPTRTYEIYTKNPHENVAESLLKLQQENPVKLLQISPTKSVNEPVNDRAYQKFSKVGKKTPKKTKKAATKAIKKSPTKIKKAAQPKKAKAASKSPKKSTKKIDKNLMKNFTNLEDVPLKIRQNLDVLSKSATNFNPLIPRFDGDKTQNLCNKIFEQIDQHKGIKRTASESSSGSGSAKQAKLGKSPTKSVLKQLKFDDFDMCDGGSKKVADSDDCEAKNKHLMDGFVDVSKGMQTNCVDVPNKMINQVESKGNKKDLVFSFVAVEEKTETLPSTSHPSPTKEAFKAISPKKLDFENLNLTIAQSVPAVETKTPSIDIPTLIKSSTETNDYFSDSDTDTAESVISDTELKVDEEISKVIVKEEVKSEDKIAAVTVEEAKISKSDENSAVAELLEPAVAISKSESSKVEEKPCLDILKTTIESLESLKPAASLEPPLMPEKVVVEQQVASILEKVIPKTLKTIDDIKIEQPEQQENSLDDEDDSQFREAVEEFHKDSIERLIQANKRFYREIQNPFKQSPVYRSNPLKMSLSFDANQSYPPVTYQRSLSDVDPRKERWCSNGTYENRSSYGSFHYEKIHHREAMSTTYSMYRAQKATQWNCRQGFEYQQEQPVTTPTTPQPSSYRVVQQTQAQAAAPLEVIVPDIVTATSPQAEALKSATSDAFSGFLKEKLSVSPSALPKTKTASSDPRLNPSLVQDVKKEEPATPKKKLSLDQYRKRKSLTSVTQCSSSSSDDIVPPLSASIEENSSSTLLSAFDPTIAAAAATG